MKKTKKVLFFYITFLLAVTTYSSNKKELVLLSPTRDSERITWSEKLIDVTLKKEKNQVGINICLAIQTKYRELDKKNGWSINKRLKPGKYKVNNKSIEVELFIPQNAIFNFPCSKRRRYLLTRPVLRFRFCFQGVSDFELTLKRGMFLKVCSGLTIDPPQEDSCIDIRKPVVNKWIVLSVLLDSDGLPKKLSVKDKNSPQYRNVPQECYDLKTVKEKSKKSFIEIASWGWTADYYDFYLAEIVLVQAGKDKVVESKALKSMNQKSL